jgi:hypothetical protein
VHGRQILIVYTRVGMHTLKGLKEGKCHKRMHLLLRLGYLRYVCVQLPQAGVTVITAATVVLFVPAAACAN